MKETFEANELLWLLMAPDFSMKQGSSAFHCGAQLSLRIENSEEQGKSGRSRTMTKYGIINLIV